MTNKVHCVLTCSRVCSQILQWLLDFVTTPTNISYNSGRSRYSYKYRADQNVRMLFILTVKTSDTSSFVIKPYKKTILKSD